MPRAARWRSFWPRASSPAARTRSGRAPRRPDSRRRTPRPWAWDRRSWSATITLRFARQALIDAGLLTRTTTELVVTGALAKGVQIASHVPVNVHW